MDLDFRADQMDLHDPDQLGPRNASFQAETEGGLGIRQQVGNYCLMLTLFLNHRW